MDLPKLLVLTYLASRILSFQLIFVFGSLIIAIYHGLIDGTKKYLIVTLS
jgi:hypothetical protein